MTLMCIAAIMGIPMESILAERISMDVQETGAAVIATALETGKRKTRRKYNFPKQIGGCHGISKLLSHMESVEH